MVIFQYGSNTCTARLNSPNRLRGDACPVGIAQTVEDLDIAFDVWSERNQCAAADLVPSPGRKAWGVLYAIPDDLVQGTRKDRKTLEQIEGPRYEKRPIRVRTPQGDEVEARTFLVRENERRRGLFTAVWYVSWIMYGLREHSVPEEYIEHVREVAIQTNRNARSAEEQINLIRTL